MKKLIAISLLLIQLFNIGGSLAIHQYFEIKADTFFNAQADKGFYNLQELTEIKLPVKTQMSADWQEYEDISGVIQFEATTYNYVKMKMTRDAIYLMCTPNYKSTRLLSGNVINAKGVKDMPVNKKDHVPPVKFILQVNSNMPPIQVAFTTPVKILPLPAVERAPELVYHHTDIPEQPPRQAC